jgi:hypothetical protein
MIHPSSAAQSYIFQQFSNCYLTESSRELNKKLLSLRNDLNHRPSAELEMSIAYRKHLQQTSEKLKELKRLYSGNSSGNGSNGDGGGIILDFSAEEAVIESNLAKFSLPPMTAELV